MKNIIQNILPASLINYVRTMLGLWGQKSYSQEGEDLILARIFKGKPSGFYIDVGAHHPVRFSNTYRLYKQGWSGINIEPNPDAIQIFKKMRKRDINLNLGVAQQETSLEYFMFNEPALNTFDKKTADARPGHYKVINEIAVEVKPLAVILDSQSISGPIDLLTIDVEGLDYDVLKSNNWNKYRPNWVLVEQLALSDISSLDFEINTYMVSKGYVLFSKTYNTLFFKKQELVA